MLSETFFDRHLTTTPIIGIFRGLSPADTVTLARRAWAADVTLVEVPIQAPEAVESLRAAVRAGADQGAEVGAGSVITVDQLDTALDAGATFVVSPGLPVPVAQECLRRGVPMLPGVATATEIGNALALGLTWLKAFPARELTPQWIAAQLGPYPGVRFVATGGIDAGNAPDFLAAGCRAVAVGSAFASAASIDRLRTAVSGHRPA